MKFPQTFITPHGAYQLGWLHPRELLQVIRIEAAVFPEPLTLPALLRLWVRPGVCYLALRQGRQLAAYIGFQLLGPTAHTISMAVHPDHRRRGLASRIQAAADEVARARGARWFLGEVRVSNLPQLRMLEKLGWRRIGLCRRFFRNGEDAVVVWNWL